MTAGECGRGPFNCTISPVPTLVCFGSGREGSSRHSAGAAAEITREKPSSLPAPTCPLGGRAARVHLLSVRFLTGPSPKVLHNTGSHKKTSCCGHVTGNRWRKV